MAVAAVLALAVVGTGAAFAYRTYVGSPRSGDPPIIKADNSPTKIVPAPADGVAKTPDRMVPGDGAEKIVSREETPVDVDREDRRSARGVSAAEPEQQPAVGGERCTRDTAATHGGERHLPQHRTAQDQDTFGQGRRSRRRHPRECAATAGKAARNAGRQAWRARASTPMPAPTRRCA